MAPEQDEQDAPAHAQPQSRSPGKSQQWAATARLAVAEPSNAVATVKNASREALRSTRLREMRSTKEGVTFHPPQVQFTWYTRVSDLSADARASTENDRQSFTNCSIISRSFEIPLAATI